MEQGHPSKANDIPWVKKSPVFYGIKSCRVQKIPPPVSDLRQINPVHILQPYFLKISSSFILSSAHRSSVSSAPLRLSNQKFLIISHLTHSCYMYCPSPYPWADHRNVWWGVQIMESLIMQFSPFFCQSVFFKSTYSPQQIIIIIIIIISSCHRFSFFPGTSLELVVNPTTQASSLSL
jgi:hypothetical protein